MHASFSPTLKQLRAFASVYQLRKLSAAGEQLALTQSAVSVLLKQLEEGLGIQLFDRTTRSLRPTQAAHDLIITVERIVRDVGLVLVTFASLWLTPKQVHEDNQFGWGPMQEVAKLFAGIFLTIIPVIAMLKAGVNGPFGAIVAAVTRPDGSPDPAMYFWATGALSSFLDNAPTYLVFFNTAGGDPAVLMTTLAPTLAAISAGAVFMGANTYIGNAPNLMVKAIAEDRGVKMPSFFGYMLWSGGILVPLFIVMTFIWFK